MTSLSVPVYEAAPRSAIWSWPWRTALILFVLFGVANWAWDISQRWYESSSGDVDALVGRISEGTMNRQVAFALLGVYGVSMLLIPSERSAKFKLLVAYPLVVFVGWALISVLWSVDRGQTMKRLVVFLAMLSTVLACVRRYDIRELAQIAFIASGLTMLVGMGNEARILATDSPSFGHWRFGGTMHPNHAGMNCAVVMLSSLYLFRISKNRFFLVVFGAGTLVLLLTKSRTALMATMTACAAYLMLATTASRAVWAMLIAGWLIASVLWLSSMQLMPDLNSAISMGRDDIKTADVKKLTGRTDIWKFAIMQAGRDPNRVWVGYGYETFWTADNARAVSQYVRFKISEGHSAYLEWYLELGLVGAGLYGFAFLVSIARWSIAARLLHSPAAALAAATLIGALIHGLAESSTGDANLPTFFIYASLAAACVLREDEELYS